MVVWFASLRTIQKHGEDMWCLKGMFDVKFEDPIYMKYFRFIEDPTCFFFTGIQFQLTQGNANCVFFCGAILTRWCCFCGKGIGNKIGLHEKGC